MTNTNTYTARDLIGFDDTMEVVDRNLGGDPNYADPDYVAKPAMVRVVGGHALYESVDNTGGRLVRLGRLTDADGHINPTIRYIDPDTLLEVIPDA